MKKILLDPISFQSMTLEYNSVGKLIPYDPEGNSQAYIVNKYHKMEKPDVDKRKHRKTGRNPKGSR